MVPKVDLLQASLKVDVLSGIFMVSSNFTIEAFKFAWHIVLTLPERETWKASPEKETWKASFKVDCDECDLIHGTNLCEACR